MSNVRQFPIPVSTENEASEWLVRLDADHVSPDVEAAFQRWLSGGPHRERAFARLDRDWRTLDELAALRGSADSVIDPDRTQAWLHEQYPREQARRRRWLPQFAAAAAILLAMLVAPSLLNSDNVQTYRTDVGQQGTYVLPDASTVQLNTNSQIEVEFSQGERHIQLARGEAYFKVTHDTNRPFIVVSDGASVRAVGTAFTVRQRGDRVEVTVTEGRVEVTPTVTATQRHPKPFTISAGGRAEVGANRVAATTLQPGVIERDLAWRKGMLAFKGESLEEVIGEVSRYTDKKIKFSDDDIQHLEVGGYFQVDDVDAILDMVAGSFSLRVQRLDDGTILLSKADPDEGG
jgi:transmembrane sensor